MCWIKASQITFYFILETKLLTPVTPGYVGQATPKAFFELRETFSGLKVSLSFQFKSMFICLNRYNNYAVSTSAAPRVD